MAIFISYPILTWDTHISPKVDTPYQPETPISQMGEGWYVVWYENCHIIIYLSFIFLSDIISSKLMSPSANDCIVLLPITLQNWLNCDDIFSRSDNIVSIWQDSGWWLVMRITCLQNRTVKSKTARCSECGDTGFFGWKKKAVSPTWPGDMGFLPVQKRCITNVTHYHTFCTPQEWYVLESHVSITYANEHIF